MALAGAGAVAIWNGISAEGRANFYEWHGREHIPERVGIPGFLSGRRYVAEYGGPEFFTLYETVTPDVLNGPDYHTRLNAPTDWTLNSTAHFRDVARALCRVDRSWGHGSGGLIGTWRFELPELNDASQDRLRVVTQDLAQLDGVAGAHLLITDRSASTVDNEERKRRGRDNQVPGWILLVEGWTDCTVFSELCAGITNRHFSSYGIDVDHGLYRLQSSLTKAEMRPPTATI
jgi:hypothetical protein